MRSPAGQSITVADALGFGLFDGFAEVDADGSADGSLVGEDDAVLVGVAAGAGPRSPSTGAATASVASDPPPGSHTSSRPKTAAPTDRTAPRRSARAGTATSRGLCRTGSSMKR